MELTSGADVDCEKGLGDIQDANAGSWRERLLRPRVLAVLYISWFLLRIPPQWQHDPYQLYLGCESILRWLQGRSPRLSEVGPFPLLQYITGVVSLWASGRGLPINVFWVWSACNILGVAGISVSLYRAARRCGQLAVGYAAVVMVLSGPLVAYAPMSLGEGFAAFLAVCFADAVTENIVKRTIVTGNIVTGKANPAVCALLFVCCGITKETAAPLLMILWVGSLWMRKNSIGGKQMLIQSAAMACALAITLGANSGFNLLRYRTPWNREYMTPDSFVRSWHHRIGYIIGLWLAPSGGVATSWPTLVIFCLGVLAVALHRRRTLVPAIVVCALLGVATLGLSAWYGPFGWWCWGPRLLLPWLPASALILLKGYPGAAAQFVDRLLRTRRAMLLTAATTCALALPHLLVATDTEVINSFFDKHWNSASGATITDPERVYSRNVFLEWRETPPLILVPVLEGVTAERLLLAAGFAASLAVLLNEARRALGAGA